MAEFVEVMKQAERMCNAYKCKDCPIAGLEACSLTVFVGKVPVEKMGEIENCIMRWAVEHPGPRYPSWKEWQERMFPNSDSPIAPCAFVSQEFLRCESNEIATCDECRAQPIPANIAEKLGIKPIGGNDNG